MTEETVAIALRTGLGVCPERHQTNLKSTSNQPPIKGDLPTIGRQYAVFSSCDLVSYALKKLQGLGVVVSQKNGKEVTYAATPEGRAHVQRYREIRESCLINALDADGALHHDIGQLGRLLRVLSGLYDQAARAAASL